MIEAHRPDRRSHPRRKCFAQGQGLISFGNGEVWSCEGIVHNTSDDGMLFQMVRPQMHVRMNDLMKQGDVFVELKLLLVDEVKKEFKIFGKVVYCEFLTASPWFGVKFDVPLSCLADQPLAA